MSEKAKKEAKPKISADDIRSMLEERYSKPGESVIAFEVANATGSASRRWADAIKFDLWPSKGHAISGFEIKISRSDWLNELKDPSKSAEISKYCDYWYLVSPDGVLGIDELPANWGWIRATPNGLTVKTRAPKRECTPLDRGFAASMIRKTLEKYADEQMIRAAEYRARKKADEVAERKYSREIEVLKNSVASLREVIKKFQDASGINIDSWRYDKAAEAIKAVNLERDGLISDLERRVAMSEKALIDHKKTLEALKGWPK